MVDARGQERVDRRRDPHLGEVAFLAHGEHLLEKERVPFSGFQDVGAQFVWHGGARRELTHERC